MRYLPELRRSPQTIPCPEYTIPLSVEVGAFRGDCGFSKFFQKASLEKSPFLSPPTQPPEKDGRGGEVEKCYNRVTAQHTAIYLG